MSCAKGGISHGIYYNVVREVEKEVVLVDPIAHVKTEAPLGGAAPAHSSDLAGSERPVLGANMHGDDASSSQQAESTMTVDPIACDSTHPAVSDASQELTSKPELSVIKVIKKIEYEVLCSQHNPVCTFVLAVVHADFLTSHSLLAGRRRQESIEAG